MSDSSPFYMHDHKPIALARTKLEAERLWTLHRDSHVVIGGITHHKDPIGFEFREYCDSHFIQSKRFGYRDHAIAYAEQVRDRYARDGWKETP